MSLPTSNLTFHADASVNTDLWQVDTAGVFSDHPTDGEAVPYVDDVEHVDKCLVSSTGAVWQSSTPLMKLPCLSFPGSLSYLVRNDADDATYVLSQLITASAFTVMASVYVTGISTNAAAAYDNDGLISNAVSGTFGIDFKNAADPHVLFYNWDGAEDTISLPISLNTSYVLMFRHEGGSIYASLNGGSETSLASGDTTGLGSSVFIGKSYDGTKFYDGRLGELAIYNAALTGSNLTDAISYFTAKWLTLASETTAAVFAHQYMQRRG